MHSDTRPLIQHDKRLVSVDNRRFEALQKPLRQRLGLIAFSPAQRRDTNKVASPQLVFRLDPPPIYTHFAFTQNPVNQSLGHALKLGAKKVINALAGKFRRNLEQLDAGGWRGRICHRAIITIFYGIEALNHCCYSRERRQKRLGLRMIAKTAIPQPTQPIWDVRPSDGLFNEKKASKAVNNSEIKPISHDAQPVPLDGCGNS